MSRVSLGAFVWGGGAGEGQGVSRLGVIYLKLQQVGQFLNMRSGPYHLNIRPELVFHTTSNPGVGGPATTYLNVVTVVRFAFQTPGKKTAIPEVVDKID